MCCPGKVPCLLSHVLHATGEGQGRLPYSYGPGADSLNCCRWQDVRRGRAYFSSPMPLHGRWEALAVLLPCPLGLLTYMATNMVSSIVLFGQGEAPALLSVAADGGSANSPTLVTSGPALPPPRVGEEEGHHFLSHSTLWQRKGGTRSPTHLRSTELITCEVNGVSYTALPLLGTRLNLPSAAVVRDRVSSPTLVTLGSAFLAIIGDKRQGGYLSPKPLHDRRWG